MHSAPDVGQDVAVRFNQNQIGKGLSSIHVYTGGSTGATLIT